MNRREHTPGSLKRQADAKNITDLPDRMRDGSHQVK